jgi:hypothetical protein
MIIGRPKAEITERARLIRTAFNRLNKDALRQKFVETQSGICFRCGNPLESEEGVFSELGHITSVLDYAACSMPIEDAIKHANCEGNLALLHASCNRSQSAADLQEELEQGAQLDAPKKMTSGEMERRREQAGAGGRISGRINGRKNKENGTGFFAPGMAAKGGRLGGRISGRKNVESGHLARIRQLPQTKKAQSRNGQKNGRKAVESGQLMRIARLGGRKNVESGELARIRQLPQTKEAQSRNGRIVGQITGRINGRKAVESGQLAQARWMHWHPQHFLRGIVHPKCIFCQTSPHV